MTYAVVYSSKTGNTAQLAQAIRSVLPEEACLYYGEPGPQALKADVIFVGFWTDKGTCDAATAAFLSTLTGQKVFLFGTAGFGGDPAYFEKILVAVGENLVPETEVVGQYMCQGRMPQGVRKRYEAMEDSPRRRMMLENFDRAASHPDEVDLENAKRMVRALKLDG